MDYLSITGILFGIIAIVFGQFLEGGSVLSLLNVPAMVIVLGGTIGAVMVETPQPVFLKALKIFPEAFRSPESQLHDYIDSLVSWSELARRQGVLALDAVLENEDDRFSRRALGLLVDGADPQTINSVLKLELDNRIEYELQAARVYESLGGYSPTIGIIGAVLGLIQVMSHLTDPSMLGPGIATAFVATIYGVGLANLIFLPIGNKLHRIIVDQFKIKEMLISGIMSISEGENPNVMKLKLEGFIK